MKYNSNTEMIEYLGMNFKKWCALDEDDRRIMHLTLETSTDTYNFTSEEEISYIDLLLLQSSTITDIRFIDNEWYIWLTTKEK